jgi:Phosphate-selective porin O and P
LAVLLNLPFFTPGSATCLAALCVLSSATAAPAQTSPAPPGVEVGLGRGITIRSADDRASMTIRVRIQTRATAADTAPDTLPATSEVLVRRARLVLLGNAAGPTFTYYVQLSFANLDNEADLRLPLRDAYVTWSSRRDLNVRVGQMKVPFSRQRVVSSSALQMVDRSIVVSELNLDRDVGVQIFSKDLLGVGKLGYAVGLFGGEGRNRLGRAAGLLYAARLEAWPFGAFDDYAEADLRRLDTVRLAVGVSAGYNQNTNRPRSTIGTPDPAGDVDYRHAAADVTVKWRGWSLTSEVLHRTAGKLWSPNTGEGTLPASRSGWGAYLQSGMMLGARWEVTARVSRLAPARGTDPTFTRARETGAGLSYYLHGHDLKVQGDYARVTEAGSGRTTQQARAQLQLFF